MIYKKVKYDNYSLFDEKKKNGSEDKVKEKS